MGKALTGSEEGTVGVREPSLLRLGERGAGVTSEGD